MKQTAVYAGVGFSILFLWLALRNANLDDIRQAFAGASIWPVVPMYLCVGGFYWLKALRWRMLLSPAYQVTTGDLVPAMMAGAAGNNLLPAHFGEIVRIYYAGSKLDIPKSTLLATLVVERVLDIIVVLSLLGLALLFGDFSAAIFAAGSLLFSIALVAALSCVVLVRYNRKVCELVAQRLTLLSQLWRDRLVNQIQNVGVGLASLRQRRLYYRVIANSFLQWGLMAACIYCALLAFELGVSPLTAILILGITVAGLALPTSPGFFGTIEYCFVLGLAAVGVDASAAVSAAIYYHLPIWLAVTLGGLLIVHLNKQSLTQLRKQASQD